MKAGYTILLTLTLTLLKIMNYINWSWWLVLVPFFMHFIFTLLLMHLFTWSLCFKNWIQAKIK